MYSLVYREDGEKLSDIEIKHTLTLHKNCVISSDDQRINVRRSDIFNDGISAFKRASYDTTKVLKVHFIGEPAVDQGGPRREFFRLFLSEMGHSSGLFCGWPDRLSPASNSQAVANKTFFICGKVIASMIIQGGEAPRCFNRPITDFIVYEEVRYSGNLDDIQDKEIQEKLKKVISDLRKHPCCLTPSLFLYTVHTVTLPSHCTIILSIEMYYYVSVLLYFNLYRCVM